MKYWQQWLSSLALAFGVLPGTAWAESEVDILINKLVEKNILSNVEAGLLRREMSETKEARNKQMAKEIVPDSARNWKWKGDLRLRDEFRDRNGTGNDVHRQRIRFRFGVEGKVADELKVVSRLATGTDTDRESTLGSADPISTNDSLDDFFRKKPVVLDLAYAEWTPRVPGVQKVAIRGGITENPLWTVTPMVWDNDLSWDGASVHLSHDIEMFTLFTNNGIYVLDTDETEAASLWVAQGGVSVMPFKNAEEEVLKNLKLTSAVAYHDYRNTVNSASAGTDPITREADNTNAANDFNQLNPSVELASMVEGIPFSFFGDWVHNFGTTDIPNQDSDQDNGFAVGVKLGKATTPFSLKNGWEGGYFFQRLERDAAFDEFVDSDFGGGGTNRVGHVTWLNLAVLKNSTVGAKYFYGEQLKGVNFDEKRVQLDWVTKF